MGHPLDARVFSLTHLFSPLGSPSCKPSETLHTVVCRALLLWLSVRLVICVFIANITPNTKQDKAMTRPHGKVRPGPSHQPPPLFFWCFFMSWRVLRSPFPHGLITTDHHPPADVADMADMAIISEKTGRPIVARLGPVRGFRFRGRRRGVLLPSRYVGKGRRWKSDVLDGWVPSKANVGLARSDMVARLSIHAATGMSGLSLLTRPDQARLGCMAYGPPLFVRKVSSMVPGVFSPSGSGPVEAVCWGVWCWHLAVRTRDEQRACCFAAACCD